MRKNRSIDRRSNNLLIVIAIFTVIAIPESRDSLRSQQESGLNSLQAKTTMLADYLVCAAIGEN